jgi:hypothetical protein
LAAAVFAFGVIAWLWWLSVPQRARFEFEGAGTLAADPDLRLVSERSPYMRTER